MIDVIEGPAGGKGPRGVKVHEYLRLPRLKDLREQFEASCEIVERIMHMPYSHYKALYEQEVEKEEAYADALKKGFKGSFYRFKQTVQDENGIDGWLGRRKRQMYDHLIAEGFYCGTYEEFLKFDEFCHWSKKIVPINPGASKFFDFTPQKPSEEELREQYQETLGMYYRGTFENFKRFRDEYTLGYCGLKGPVGHFDNPGERGPNGGAGIYNCEDKYEKGYSLRNHGIKGAVGHVGPQVVIECDKAEESPVLRSYNLAVQTGGFQGSFEEYGKMMEGRPKRPTGQSAGPGLVGYSQRELCTEEDESR